MAMAAMMIQRSAWGNRIYNSSRPNNHLPITSIATAINSPTPNTMKKFASLSQRKPITPGAMHQTAK
jgi:CDP-diacylglycerol pyrophosphatase